MPRRGSRRRCVTTQRSQQRRRQQRDEATSADPEIVRPAQASGIATLAVCHKILYMRHDGHGSQSMSLRSIIFMLHLVHLVASLTLHRWLGQQGNRMHLLQQPLPPLLRRSLPRLLQQPWPRWTHRNRVLQAAPRTPWEQPPQVHCVHMLVSRHRFAHPCHQLGHSWRQV